MHLVRPLRRSSSSTVIMAASAPSPARSSSSSSSRRFSPLNVSHSPQNGDAVLRGVIFDMDGTLCEPQTYMFKEMRSVLGIPPSVDILQHIETLPPDDQPAAYSAIRSIEAEAMTAQTPQPGLTRLMSYLDSCGIRKAILTRNFDVPVQHLLTKHLSNFVFHPVVTRDFRPSKPHPAGILHIARNWGLRDPAGEADARGLIMVGDSIDDMTAGKLAGAATVLLLNDVNRALAHHDHTDLAIEQLDDLIQVLDQGFQARLKHVHDDDDVES